MKKSIIQFILIFFVFSFSGCKDLGFTSSVEEKCACCTEGLFESEPIHDLIDGDNKWMGIELGVTRSEQIEEIFKDIPHKFCYSRQEEDGSIMVCNDIPEKYFENIGGYVFVHLTEFNCQRFKVSWELNRIRNIIFSCRNCITVDQLFSQIGEPPYISAFPAGLHESELLATVFYPEQGISVSIEILDPLDPQLTQTNTISYFSLTLPTLDTKRLTLKEWMSETDYKCLREWLGYGNIVNIYYSGNSDGTCP